MTVLYPLVVACKNWSIPHTQLDSPAKALVF